VRYVIEPVNLAMMDITDRLEGRRHILQEVKSVGDLRGVGSPVPHAGGRGVGAVTGDNRDGGTGVKPRGHGFGRSILE
jgi:hypothetical protein